MDNPSEHLKNLFVNKESFTLNDLMEQKRLIGLKQKVFEDILKYCDDRILKCDVPKEEFAEVLNSVHDNIEKTKADVSAFDNLRFVKTLAEESEVNNYE
jgi:hypothetical protein